MAYNVTEYFGLFSSHWSILNCSVSQLIDSIHRFILFLKLRPLFHLFSFFQTNITILTTNQCEKCPSSIRRQDSNSQPSDYESPPLTTRPGLPPAVLFCLAMYFLTKKYLVVDVISILQTKWNSLYTKQLDRLIKSDHKSELIKVRATLKNFWIWNIISYSKLLSSLTWERFITVTGKA